MFLFKTHPFQMSFDEIKDMTFKQACLMIEELQKMNEEKSKAVQNMAKRSKEIMPVLDVTRGIYG